MIAPRNWAVAGLVLLTLAVMGSCGGTGPAAADDPGLAPTLRPVPPGATLDDLLGEPIPDYILSDALHRASTSEQSMLQDGFLSRAEYEAAHLAMIECLRVDGLDVDGPIELNGVYQYNFRIVYPGDPGPGRAVWDECRKQYTAVLEEVWGFLTGPLAADVVSSSRAFAADCLKEKGFSPATASFSSSVPAEREAFSQCVTLTQKRFNLGTMYFGVQGDGD